MTKFGNCKYCEGTGDDNGKGKGKSWGGGIAEKCWTKMPGELRVAQGNRGSSAGRP